MSSQLHMALLEVEHPRGVTVVRFHIEEILEQEEALAIGEQLLRIASMDSPRLAWQDCLRLVLNLAGVRTMNSTLLAKLFALCRNVKATGGRLALRRVESRLREVFQLVKLTERVSLYGEELEAVQALCAAAPELRERSPRDD